jgi:hypothetical protein
MSKALFEMPLGGARHLFSLAQPRVRALGSRIAAARHTRCPDVTAAA